MGLGEGENKPNGSLVTALNEHVLTIIVARP